MKDYYQLELDDMVIALTIKDAEIEQLQKKLDIAVKALNRIREVSAYNPGQLSYVGQFATRKVKTALKEIDLVGTSAKEEQ